MTPVVLLSSSVRECARPFIVSRGNNVLFVALWETAESAKGRMQAWKQFIVLQRVDLRHLLSREVCYRVQKITRA